MEWFFQHPTPLRGRVGTPLHAAKREGKEVRYFFLRQRTLASGLGAAPLAALNLERSSSSQGAPFVVMSFDQT